MNTQVKKAVTIGVSVISFITAYAAMQSTRHAIVNAAVQSALNPPADTAAPTAVSLADKVHVAQVAAADKIRATLPKMLDDATTLTDVRAAGGELIYMYEVTVPLISASDGAAFQADVAKKVCASDMRKVIGWGGSYGYEYRNGRALVYRFDISSCA